MTGVLAPMSRRRVAFRGLASTRRPERDAVSKPPAGVLPRGHLGGRDGQLRDSAARAGERRRHGSRTDPELHPAACQGDREADGGRQPGQHLQPVHPLLEPDPPPEPGYLHLARDLPHPGPHGDRSDAAVDARARRRRHDPQLRARDAAGHLRRLAPRRLARPGAPVADLSAGDPVLLPRADTGLLLQHPARLAAGNLGLRPGLHPRVQPVVHRQHARARDPAGGDDHRDLARRLDAGDAQHDADHDLRGLRARCAGQGPPVTPRDVHLRAPATRSCPTSPASRWRLVSWSPVRS